MKRLVLLVTLLALVALPAVAQQQYGSIAGSVSRPRTRERRAGHSSPPGSQPVPGAPVLHLAAARVIRNAVAGDLRAFETRTPRVPRARRSRATYP